MMLCKWSVLLVAQIIDSTFINVGPAKQAIQSILKLWAALRLVAAWWKSYGGLVAVLDDPIAEAESRRLRGW